MRMRRFPLHLLPLLALLLHTAEAGVLTEIQAGPLYRVVGKPLSISCNVSGFRDPDATQNFEFRVTKPSKPNFEINIISTADADFPYGAYSSRVASGEVSVERVSPTSVIFRIASLQKNDEGDYDCSVINSQDVYFGTYSVKSTVRVIDDSLSVSSTASASPGYNQGDTLTLTCRASSNTIQHTHLSLAWYLRRDGEGSARPLISLDRDFTLRPGDGFEGRYRDGLLRLDKVGEAVYTLTVEQLEVADQGSIHCQAREWIQDADLSWYPITQKDGEEAIIKVKGPDLVPDAQTLAVRVSAVATSLQEGQELVLTCSVDTQDLQQKFLTVGWLRGGLELARVGPSGVLTAGAQYAGRERDGELRASRVGLREYRLVLKPVRTEDTGEYICRAWPEERAQDGTFTQGAAQDSSAQMINISATERSLSVEMQSAVSVNEGETLTLACRARGGTGQLSVAWQRRSDPAAAFADVASLSREGVAEVAGELAARRVVATRPAADAFSLEMEGVKAADAGLYRCTVSEWSANAKTSSQTGTTTVTVNSLDSLMKVNLISRSNTATVGDMVELRCRVRGPRRATTVIWSHRQTNGDATGLSNILTVYHDGVISWSGDHSRYQLRVESEGNDITYFLLINGITQREAGAYQCMLSVFQENTHKRLTQSNPVAVMVKDPASKLSLTAPVSLKGSINTDIEMKCMVLSVTSETSRFAVTWKLRQETQNLTIVSSDRDSAVTLGPLEASYAQRLSTRRTAGGAGPVFQLTVRQALISDKGSYQCEVVEWLQDPSGEWYALPPVSTNTVLTLIEPATDLQLDQNERQVFAREGEEPRFECNVTSDTSSPSLFYKVTWLYMRSGSAASPLVELDHNGLLRYPESAGGLRGLQGRLRVSRPAQGSFRLGIAPAHEADSGTYRCRVEQYQLDRKGGWEQKTSISGGAIILLVNVTENKLAMVRESRELNVSTSQDFTVPCSIARLSSAESQLQVTWFWQKTQGTRRRPILHVYRNSTIQRDGFGGSGQMMLTHPSPKHFSLKVSGALPENSGVYFCEVEEWLPSLSRGWWRSGVEESGSLTISVQALAEGANSQKGCSSTWTGVLAGMLVCSLVVVCLLVLRACRAKRAEKKAGQSLWAEQPLNGKPSADD